MAIQNGLGRGPIFFQNQECVNILGCSVTFYEYKIVFLMLVDNVCTIQALFVTKPLHYSTTQRSVDGPLQFSLWSEVSDQIVIERCWTSPTS